MSVLPFHTRWRAGRIAMASKATSTKITAPTSYDAALRQQKHDRNIAEKNSQALILDILGASATRRDARAYLNHFGPQKTKRKPQKIPSTIFNTAGLNLGSLFKPELVTSDEDHTRNDALNWEEETLHVALVKIRAPQTIDDVILRGVLHTLEQLSQLGMQIVVVVDCDDEVITKDTVNVKDLSAAQADRIVETICSLNGTGARRVDSVLNISSYIQGQSKDRLHISDRNLLLSPLRRGMISVVAPIGFDFSSATKIFVPGNEVVLALTRELAGISTVEQYEDDGDELARKIQSRQSETSVDRIIVLDPLGGIPHNRHDRAHGYINLEQEYDGLMQFFSKDSKPHTKRHMNNLSLMRSILALLPSASSGFITTPSAVAKADTNPQFSGPGLAVGTRSQRNLLIHNLLTNKPAVSFSLPQHRQEATSTSGADNVSTLLKRGMSLTIIPELPPGGWTCPAQEQGTWTANIKFGLRNPKIDYQRLTHLINDSFGRTLDVRAYDERTRDSLAGVIIAGDYEGAAIFTWELPPSKYNLDAPSHPWVPYLDKFAVLRSAQGTATADVLWNTMTEAFPQGFCWRSRTVNPVNKWYFERSQGSWHLPGTQWTMFWSKKGVLGNSADDKSLTAFLGVCVSVKPSWIDSQAVD